MDAMHGMGCNKWDGNTQDDSPPHEALAAYIPSGTHSAWGHPHLFQRAALLPPNLPTTAHLLDALMQLPLGVGASSGAASSSHKDGGIGASPDLQHQQQRRHLRCIRSA